MADMNESRVAQIIRRLEGEKKIVTFSRERTHQINVEINEKLDKFESISKERQAKSQIDASKAFLNS